MPAKAKWADFGTLYQVFNRASVASGCFDTLSRAQESMKPGYTMDVVREMRTKDWVQKRVLIKTLNYREALAFTPDGLPLHHNAQQREWARGLPNA